MTSSLRAERVANGPQSPLSSGVWLFQEESLVGARREDEGRALETAPLPMTFWMANCSLGVTSKQHPFPDARSSTPYFGVLHTSLL